MNGIIFQNTLRTRWKQLLTWGIGMGLLGLYIAVIMSDAEIVEGYSGLLSSLPPAMLNILGISDIGMLASTEGLISSLYVVYAMLFLSVYGVSAGLQITANEEDEGIMDVLLALPISRTRVVVEKLLAYALIAFGIVMLCVILPTTAVIFLNPEAETSKIAISILNIYPGLLMIIGVTSLLSTIVRRRTTAMGLSAMFIMASYVLNMLGNVDSETILGTFQRLSFFYYTDGQAIITNTFNPLASIILIVVAIVCMGLSVVMFNQRDIGL